MQQQGGVPSLHFLYFTESLWLSLHDCVPPFCSQLLDEDVREWSPLFLATLMVLVIQGKDHGDGLSEVEIESSYDYNYGAMTLKDDYGLLLLLSIGCSIPGKKRRRVHLDAFMSNKPILQGQLYDFVDIWSQ